MGYTVLITDSVDPVCIALLQEHGMEPVVQLDRSDEALQPHLERADGWIIRSGTRITGERPARAGRLRVVGRAGVGVDNVDVDAATRRGVLVINAPDGNTISTAEHTCAMLLAMARRIPQAHASTAAGRWDRSSFTGTELYEKTLGVVGLGKIGRAVAERMSGFGMSVIGYDPMLSPEGAERAGVRLVSMDELIRRSDFITVHTPLNDQTRGLLGREALARCRRGVYIVNCARGGIVDEGALLEALESGQVGGAALDVYEHEPPAETSMRLLEHPRVVVTPHIAASTDEAQAKVAVQVTEQVIAALNGEAVQSPVNALAIRMAVQPEVQPFLDLADRLGRIAGQLGDAPVRGVTVRCSGDVPRRFSEVLTIGALRGVLARWVSEPVNLVNAPWLAEEMGLAVREERETARSSYTSLLEIDVETERERHRVAGTIFDRAEPRLVRIDDYWIEVRPEGRLLLYRNVDRPGMLAAVGRLLAEAGVNIGALALGRTDKGSPALTVISVDDDLPAPVMRRVAALEGVEHVRMIVL